MGEKGNGQHDRDVYGGCGLAFPDHSVTKGGCLEPLPLLTAGERYRTAPIRECLVLQEVLLEDLLEGPVGDTVITSAQISDPYVLISLRWVGNVGE